MVSSEAASSSEALGQQRALPDWGYDHGFAFDALDETHPLWLETAVEEFVHSLLYPSEGEWHRSDRAIRQVMRARAGAPLAEHYMHCGASSAERTLAMAPKCVAEAVATREGAAAQVDEEASTTTCDAERGSGDAANARWTLCEYARRHKRALRTASTVALDEQRYLVAEAGNWGLGNRLYSLVSRRQAAARGLERWKPRRARCDCRFGCSHPLPLALRSHDRPSGVQVSCLALALVTNRTLLVRDWHLFPAWLPQVRVRPKPLA